MDAEALGFKNQIKISHSLGFMAKIANEHSLDGHYFWEISCQVHTECYFIEVQETVNFQ